MTTRWNNALSITVIGLACLLVMGRQLVDPGIYSCINEDTAYYINWVRQVADGMASGLLYPRWMPDSHAGYGSPDFVFYPPLAVFSSSVLLLITGNMLHSVVLIKSVGVLLSGIFMYRFLCRSVSWKSALAGAVLYMLMPYRVYEMYFLGVHASKLTYVWLPLVFYYLDETLNSGRTGRSIVLLGVSFALLCLTHILYAYMALFVMSVYALFMSNRGPRKMGFFYSLSGVALGLALAGVYIIPAMMERANVHFYLLTTRVTFRYYNNYLFNTTGTDLAFWFYRYLSVTIVTTVGLGVSIVLAGWQGVSSSRKGIMFAFSAALIFTVFMMSSLSEPVWKHTPGMSTLGFPTRWATPMVFCSAALAATGASGIGNIKSVLIKVLSFVLVGVFTIWSGYYIYDAISRGCIYTGKQIADLPYDMDVQEYIPSGVSIDWLKAEQNKSGIPPVRPTEVSKNVKLDVKEWLPQERVIGYISGEDTVLRLRTFFYPGWRAFRDGTELAVEPERESGAMLINAPAGSYNIRLTFTDTPVRRAGLLVTLAGILASIAILFIGNRK